MRISKKATPPAAFALLVDDVEWNEVKSNSLADCNLYRGAAAIGEGVFGRLPQMYDGFAAVPEKFIAEGDRVIVILRYFGTQKVPV